MSDKTPMKPAQYLKYKGRTYAGRAGFMSNSTQHHHDPNIHPVRLHRVRLAKERIDAGVYDQPELARVAVAEVVERILDEAEIAELMETYWDDRADEYADELGDRWDGLG